MRPMAVSFLLPVKKFPLYANIDVLCLGLFCYFIPFYDLIEKLIVIIAIALM